MKKTNPAWLPAGVYLGLVALAALATAAAFLFGPIKEGVTVGDSFDRAPAVVVDAYSGNVTHTKLKLRGNISTPRFRPNAAAFRGHLTVYAAEGDPDSRTGGFTYYNAKLDIPLSPASSENSPLSGEHPSIYFNDDRTGFCYGPVLQADYYSSTIGQYYIVAPASNVTEAQALLQTIPNTPILLSVNGKIE